MRLESLSTFIIDRLVFRKEPKDKHVIRLSATQDKEWFKSYSEDAPIELPPSNSSELVKLELLDMAIECASTKKPAKLEHKYDDDFMWAFKELVKSNDLQWSNKYFKYFFRIYSFLAQGVMCNRFFSIWNYRIHVRTITSIH